MTSTSTTRLEITGVQADVLAYLRRRPDVFVQRNQANGSGGKGIADCTICYKGLYIAVEFKADLNGSYGVTKPQEIRGRQVRRAGGLWFAVDSLSEVKEILNNVDRAL